MQSEAYFDLLAVGLVAGSFQDLPKPIAEPVNIVLLVPILSQPDASVKINAISKREQRCACEHGLGAKSGKWARSTA